MLFSRKEIGPFVARSWQVAWPMTLIMFFEFLISLTDVYIAGRVNKEVQAAYGFVAQVYFIFIVVANAFSAGAVAVVSLLTLVVIGSARWIVPLLTHNRWSLKRASPTFTSA